MIRQFIVDAFTDRVFGGNPAAVCVMESWPEEALMKAITRENNLSETAFAVKEGDRYHLRWFTPGGEIDLCGHATLGTAYVILNFYENDASSVSFRTLSGTLTVTRQDDLYTMDFPAYTLQPVEVTDRMEDAIGARPVEAYMGRDLLCVMPEEFDIRHASVQLDQVEQLDGLLLHITGAGRRNRSQTTLSDAAGQENSLDRYDCISRSFAPKLKVNEDPVCGSGHCHIVPYWTNKLQKDELICYQASERGGVLYCQQDNERIRMSGNVALYSIAELQI